jgi:hypothetical protein
VAAFLDITRYPPVGEGFVRFIACNETVHDVPEEWLAQAYTIDPELRLIPGPDANVLILTAEDRAFLWCCGIESPADAA